MQTVARLWNRPSSIDATPIPPSVYRASIPLERRISSCQRALRDYPDRVPIVLEGPDPSSRRCKYLAPDTMTVGQFMCVVRSRLRIEKQQALLLFVDHVIPFASEPLRSLYNKYKHPDDAFLYMRYRQENTFG